MEASREVPARREIHSADAGGTVLRRFPVPLAKADLEVDGHSHDVLPECDEARDAHLRSEGFRVLHFSNADVLANTDGVIETIRTALQEEPTPGPSRKREGSK